MTPPPSIPASALKLTGITTFPPASLALFALQEPGRQPVYSSPLREGQTGELIAELQVLRIDAKDGAVQVRFRGEDLVLNFVETGLSLPRSPVRVGAARPLGARTPAVRLPARPTTSSAGVPFIPVPARAIR